MALLAALTRKLSRAKGRLRFAWPLPLFLAALLVAGMVTQAPLRARQAENLAVMLGFAVAIVAAADLDRVRRRVIAVPFAVAMLLVAVTADVLAQGTLDEESDLAAIVAVAAATCAAPRLRARVAEARASRLAAVLSGATALAFLVLVTVERLAPGWRVPAWQHARFEERLARACRSFIDFDLDGFSPFPWGGDCDDLNPTRNPLAREGLGRIDANCNGVTPSDHPTDEDRGLAPPEGEPELAPSEVDRVVLITIDCLRQDAFRAKTMPRLTELAARGLTFTRAYAAGSRTNLSLPLIHRVTDAGPNIVLQLSRAGVKVDAVVGFRNNPITESFDADFPDIEQPQVDRERFTAEDVTDRALRKIAAAAGKRQYLWVHYYDMHDPIVPEVGGARQGSHPDDLPEVALYLDQASRIDHELGRLVDALPSPERTVVLIAADHGEGFGTRHGVRFHGISGYEEIIHIPVVLVAPGIAPGSYDGLITHRDFPATLVGAFGLGKAARDAEVFGRSLLRLRTAASSPLHRFVVTRSARSTRRGDRQMAMAAIVEGDEKLVETFEDGLLEMYNLASNPYELENLVPERPANLEKLRKDLALYRDIDRWP